MKPLGTINGCNKPDHIKKFKVLENYSEKINTKKIR
jgi:hypothetical protein